jgi:hypothetical protein
MPFGLKKFVRAVSPFIRGNNASTQQTNQDDNDTEVDYSKYDWDLSQTDLKVALKSFYKQYNPEKSFIVGEILQKYEGEEIILLQQLCERYNLTVEDMQQFLDQAPMKDHLFEENLKKEKTRRASATKTSIFARRPSFSASVNSEENNNTTNTNKPSPKGKHALARTNSENTLEETTKTKTENNPQRRKSTTTGRANTTTANKDFETNSLSEIESQKSGTNPSSQQKIQNFYWDLSDVDVGQALKLLYKEMNPKKSPNTAALDQKSNKEILNLLRQLCKRHCLTESEMDVYLRKAVRKSHSAAPVDEDEEDPALLEFEMEIEKPKRITNERRPSTSYYHERSTSSHPQNQRSSSPNPNQSLLSKTFPSQDDREEEDNDRRHHHVNEVQSPPPPPPPPRSVSKNHPPLSHPPHHQQQQQQQHPHQQQQPHHSTNVVTGKNFAPFSQNSGDQYEELVLNENEEQQHLHHYPQHPGAEDDGVNRFSVDHLKPMLPNGTRFSYGPILREMKSSNTSSKTGNNKSDDSEEETVEQLQQRTLVKSSKHLLINNSSHENSNNQHSSMNRLFSLSEEVKSTSAVHALAEPNKKNMLNTPTTNTTNNNNVNSPELASFRNELEKTKQQILEMTKENQLVLSMIKNNNPSSALSVTSREQVMVPTENKGVQADDIHTKTELMKLRNQILVLEGKRENHFYIFAFFS